MGVGANSMLTGIPVWGMVKKETFFNAKTAQLLHIIAVKAAKL